MSIDERIEALIRASEAQRAEITALHVNIESLHANIHELWQASQRHDAALATNGERLGLLTAQMSRLTEAMTQLAQTGRNHEGRLNEGGL
jgi:hypothetical protein